MSPDPGVPGVAAPRAQWGLGGGTAGAAAPGAQGADWLTNLGQFNKYLDKFFKGRQCMCKKQEKPFQEPEKLYFSHFFPTPPPATMTVPYSQVLPAPGKAERDKLILSQALTHTTPSPPLQGG
ncbi:A Disintegrin And Metalloproteinase With Thrombospondin Motifs 10 [Manis pentadactyla]|nr:A Disintegrin And Metalloproteinase With Thrombospondin Motifs 10 [Manis pentadactyla]